MTDLQIVKQAIKESDLKGYKWTAKKDGGEIVLKWSYLDVEFRISDSDNLIKVTDQGRTFIVTWYGDEFSDYTERETALSEAVKMTIRKANYIY